MSALAKSTKFCDVAKVIMREFGRRCHRIVKNSSPVVVWVHSPSRLMSAVDVGSRGVTVRLALQSWVLHVLKFGSACTVCRVWSVQFMSLSFEVSSS